MVKFKFRLETLRKIRIAHRNTVRTKLAEAFQAAQVLERQQQDLANELAGIQEQQRSEAANQQTNINTVIERHRYQAALRSQQSILQQQSARLEEEIEKRRQSVVEADKEVRVLDKLEQRQLQKFQEEAMKMERQVLDEIGLTRWESES